MYKIIPGILEKEWAVIEKKIELVKPFAKSVHIDIVDGKFAQNTTFLDPTPFKKYTSDLFFELHMMVENPIQYLKPFADAGFKRFLGHIEKMPDQVAFVAEGQLLGEVGLALDGKTAVDAIQIPLDDLDAVLMMTIQAGFSGQTFTSSYLEKVKTLSAKTKIPIEVDGGINDQTIVEAKNAGASRFVSTSFLFKTDTPATQYHTLSSCFSKTM